MRASTGSKRFAIGLLNPRVSPVIAGHRTSGEPWNNRSICRAFLDLPKTQLLIAMQKVVGSSPISRLREARFLSGFFAF